MILENISNEASEQLHCIISSIYFDGQCYEFAQAVQEATDLQIVGLWLEDTWRHAGIRLFDGSILDAKGIKTTQEFAEQFNGNASDVSDITVDDLIKVRPLNPAPTLIKLLQVIYPNLPWKKDSLIVRMKIFLEELEELSKKHRIWIRSPYVTVTPLLADSDADEEPYYKAQIVDSGLTVSFDREFV